MVLTFRPTEIVSLHTEYKVQGLCRKGRNIPAVSYHGFVVHFVGLLEEHCTNPRYQNQHRGLGSEANSAFITLLDFEQITAVISVINFESKLAKIESSAEEQLH